MTGRGAVDEEQPQNASMEERPRASVAVVVCPAQRCSPGCRRCCRRPRGCCCCWWWRSRWAGILLYWCRGESESLFVSIDNATLGVGVYVLTCWWRWQWCAYVLVAVAVVCLLVCVCVCGWCGRFCMSRTLFMPGGPIWTMVKKLSTQAVVVVVKIKIEVSCSARGCRGPRVSVCAYVLVAVAVVCLRVGGGGCVVRGGVCVCVGGWVVWTILHVTHFVHAGRPHLDHGQKTLHSGRRRCGQDQNRGLLLGARL